MFSALKIDLIDYILGSQLANTVINVVGGGWGGLHINHDASKEEKQAFRSNNNVRNDYIFLRQLRQRLPDR